MGLARLVFVVGLLAGAPALQAAGDFAYVPAARPALAAGAVVIDTRPSEACAQRSLVGARCLAASELFGPQRRLPSYRDILWLFGTIGLRGHETALVVGEDTAARDFVAGLLYLAGQARVLVLTEPVGHALAAGLAAAPGRPRSFARETVFEAPMRDALVVLGRELREPLPASPAGAYGRDAYEGIAQFTQLRAGLGAEARVYVGSRAEWFRRSAN